MDGTGPDDCPVSDFVKSESDLKRVGWGDVELRDYQLAGVNWMIQRYHKGHGCILGDEMGLGKTCQTIAYLTYTAKKKSKKKPHIVISPLSVLNNWIKEFERFSPDMKVQTYVGDKEKRAELAQEIKDKTRNGGIPFDVLLTTYELCLKDSSFLGSFSWHVLVVDEGHRLKNSESLLSQTLTVWDVEQHILLTGTPIQNNLKELYSLLSFVSPKKFKLSKQQTFLDKFCDNEDKKVIEELHELLQPFILRRTKDEVLTDLPNKSEIVLYHGLTALQKKLYKAILTKDISAFEAMSTGMGGPSTTRLMNILMQLRKCVNHPYLFDGVEPEPFLLGDHLIDASGKLILIDKLLDYLQKNNHKVLMFSQMTHMLDILQDYLGYKGFTYERLDGSVRGEERYLAVQNFNENEDTFVFLLSTRAGGQGLNLIGADTVIFVDSDFNPQNDLQAAARAHRIGQTRAVKVIRLIGKNSVEEIILDRAEEKLKLTDKVIESGQFSVGTSKQSLFTSDKLKLQDILKYGVESLLSDEDTAEEDTNFHEILGPTVSGEWQLKEVDESVSKSSQSMNEDIGEAPQSMYVFEGTDYSKEPTAADVKAFTSLIDAEKALQIKKEEEGRAMRRKMSHLMGPLPEVPGKPRKKLSPEELEERRKKRQAAAELRAKAAEEEELRKAQRRREKQQELWKKLGYTSANIPLDSEGEEEEEDDLLVEEEENRTKAINYVSGDVTNPMNTGTNDAIVVHCADDSGKWGRGGIFSALNKRSDLPEQRYELAGQMDDLALGDCHLIPIDNKDSREEGSDWLALIIAQHRDKRNKLSGIKLSALQHALERVYHVAKEKKASVHLPRIGHDTPGFNWYGTERLIKKHLASKGVPTFIYYFPRRQMAKKRSLVKDDSERDYKAKKENSTILKKDISTTVLKKETSHVKASTSRQGSNCSQAEITLPDLFTGLAIHLYDCSADTMKRLKRFIIAYDGDLCQIIDEKTTHIVVQPDISFQDLDSVVEKFKSVPVVSSEWLEDCIKKGKLLSTTNYLFS